MISEQNISSSLSPSQQVQRQSQKQTQPQQTNENKSPMESLSLQQIQKLLEDTRIQSNENQQQQKLKKKQGKNIQGSEEKQKTEQSSNVQDEIRLEDVGVSSQEIIFGQPGLIPGAIDQIDFSVSLNPKEYNSEEMKEIEEQPTNILRIIAVCRNQQFDGLDEYVFSVRGNNSYDYYEEIRFKIKRGQRADIKVAVKIPALKQNYVINGMVQVRFDTLEPIIIPIVAKCIVPQIVCLRTLYNQQEGTNVIRIPAKKCMQRTPPIPFKNLSPFNLSLQCQAISNENFSDKPYDILVQNFVGCHANSQFFVNMQLKQNINYVGVLPSRAWIRKILLMKVKNSSVILHFPIEVCVFEGQNLQGN